MGKAAAYEMLVKGLKQVYRQTTFMLARSRPFNMAPKRTSQVYDTSGIEYPRLTKADLPELRTLVKEAYATNEPIILCLHGTPDEFMTYIMDSIEHCIKNNGKIHVGARDLYSGKLIGCMVNNIIMEHKGSPWTFAKCSNNKERTKRDIYVELEHSDVICDNADLFEYVLLTVDPSYSGRGIAKRMVMKSEALAIKEGLEVGLAVTTNLMSQHIFTKLGYRVYHTFDYATFELDGKRVLDPVPAGDNKGLLIQSKFLF